MTLVLPVAGYDDDAGIGRRALITRGILNSEEGGPMSLSVTWGVQNIRCGGMWTACSLKPEGAAAGHHADNSGLAGARTCDLLVSVRTAEPLCP